MTSTFGRRVLTGLALTAAIVAAPGATPAMAATAQAPAHVGTATAWPAPGPKCAHLAPEGAVFVRRVQPPLGIGYDVWALRSGELRNIYC